MPFVFLVAGDPILLGEASGDAFGAALGGGHDIDGDGQDDLVVGAPGHDAGGTDAGAVYVYPITSTGIDAASGERTDGDTTGGGLGSALLLVPDLDGDGYADVVVGAPGADEAKVYAGGSGGLSLATDLAGTSGTRFGLSLGGGDFDGDGDLDLAVGAPDGDTVTTFENDDGVIDGAGWSTLAGESTGDLFGYALAGVPDADGDGDDELAVGAPAHNNGSRLGETYVFLGADDGVSATVSWTEPENLGGTGIGTALASGDFDGDGLGDLATGTTGDHQVWVYAGSSAGLAAAGSYRLGGGITDVDAGEIVLAGVGDSDDDGDDELAFSGEQTPRMAECGWCDGRTTALAYDVATEATVEFYPADPTSFAATGDVDGNGWADLAVGLASDAGMVSIRLAATDADGDGAYADHGDLLADCDDDDDEVFPATDDPPGDGIDQDCDGMDGALAPDHATTCVVVNFDTLPSFRGNYCGFDPCPVDLAAEVWDEAVASDCGRDEGTSGTIGTCDSESGPRLACEGSAEGGGVTHMSTRHYDDGVRCWSIDERVTTTTADVDLDTPTASGLSGARYQSQDGTSTGIDDGHGHLRWPDGTVSWFSTSSADDREYDTFDLYVCGGESTDVVYDDCAYGYAWDYGCTDAITTYTITTETTVAEVSDRSPCNTTESRVYFATIDGTMRLVDSATWAPLGGTDDDGDGWPVEHGDCDDTDPEVNPCGEEDGSDSVDEDCSGRANHDGDGDGADDATDCDPLDPSVGNPWLFYPDRDGDGYGAEEGEYGCEASAGNLENSGDCDDDDATTYPGAPEYCDGVDNDCDYYIDELAVDAPAWVVDHDGDGYGAVDGQARNFPCDEPGGATQVDGDCDDTDETVYPGAPDRRGDGIDQDCDGADDPRVESEGDDKGQTDAGCAGEEGDHGGCAGGGGLAPLVFLLLRRRGSACERLPRAKHPCG